MLDAHCHLDLQTEEAQAVWSRAQACGVEHAIMAGVSPQGWAAQRVLCTQLPGVTRCAGLHPWTVARAKPGDVSDWLACLQHEVSRGGSALVGIGEMGLDRSPRLRREGRLQFDLQIEAFRAQLSLARSHSLPVVLHVVHAHGAALEIVGSDGLPSAGGMVHSFSGSAEVARDWLALGMHLSISPQVCRPQAHRLRNIVAEIPPDRLLVETDSPDQTAEPGDLLRVIQTLAALRGESPDALSDQTARNARRLFRLSPIA